MLAPPIDNIGIAFLQLILPEKGHYIATLKRTGGEGILTEPLCLDAS